MEKFIIGTIFGLSIAGIFTIYYEKNADVIYEQGVKDCMNGKAIVEIKADTVITYYEN